MKRFLVLGLVVAGCGGTTGSALVSFDAVASGPLDANGEALSFTTGVGAQVTLTHALLRFGAVYLNQSVPLSGAASGPCISPGIYVAEAFGPMTVDLLSPRPVPFPTRGEGTETRAKTAEVWLTGGDVNADADSTVIVDVAGTAQQGGQTYPFTAAVTIGSNRKANVTSPAFPGSSPICHQRIVTPILVDLTPTEGGTLSLRIDPRPMFNAVDFSTLAGPPYRIPDDATGAGGALFRGLVSSSGVYTLAWSSAP
jgi:hypothetical protein